MSEQILMSQEVESIRCEMISMLECFTVEQLKRAEPPYAGLRKRLKELGAAIV